MGVRGLVFQLIFASMFTACTFVDRPPAPPSVAALPTAYAGRTITAPVTDTAVTDPDPTSAPASLPIAVRVLKDDPHDVVLQARDVRDGFYLSAEYVTDRLELWPARQSLVDSRRRNVQLPAGMVSGVTGTGYHAVLARNEGADTEGPVSVATTAVRYERTTWAADAFASALANATFKARTAMMETRAGDDASVWRYRLAGAVVDQVLMRTRNYILATTLVRYPIADEPVLAPRYAALLRSKLRD